MYLKLSKVFFGAVLLLVAGCGRSHMAVVTEPAAITTATPDKATLVVLRPSMQELAIQSSVFDVTNGNPEFIGIVSAGTKLAYNIAPGRRRLMVIGESADFMDAELSAAKTYYARIEPHPGVWKSRFSLAPIPASSTELASNLQSCKWVENTPASIQWARKNMPSIVAKQTKYLPDWEAKTNRPFLAMNEGR